MPLREREQRCLDFINGKLGDAGDAPVSDEDAEWLFVFSHKFQLTAPVDMYHRIAQALGLKNLSVWCGTVVHRIDIGGKEGIDHWSVTVANRGDEEFLRKYGASYKIEWNSPKY